MQYGIYTDKVITWLKKLGKKEYTFKSLPRLLDMIEPTSKSKAYCQKLIDTLVKEGYSTDAKIASGCLKQMNGEKVAMATMDEQNTIDKFEPKFKVGDWVVIAAFESKDYCPVGKVVDIKLHCNKTGEVTTSYIIEGLDGKLIDDGIDPNFSEGQLRYWTIADAKDGNVLATNSNIIFIFKYLDEEGTIAFRASCTKNGGVYFPKLKERLGDQDVYPATKEQRDLLFQKMEHAGYTFDSEKKELKKIEEEYDGEDYGIDGLWHAHRILEKTLGKVDGYQSDDGILEHKCAISAVKKLYEKKPTVIIPKFRVGDEIKTSNEESLTITKIDEKGYWSEDLFICDFDEECIWDLVEQKSAWSDEDEQIMKEIAEFIYNSAFRPKELKKKEKWLNWFNKQGEKLQGKSALKAVNEEKVANQICVKPSDKVEPKFQQGQWIVWQNKCYKVNDNSCGYELIDQDDLSTSLEYGTVDESAHLWEVVKDGKDGDVLACESGWACIFKTLVNDETFSSYCFMDRTKWFCETGSECHTLNKRFIKAYNGEIKPATKEQRDQLEKAMTDAGYTFDFDKKELKKIEEEYDGKDYGIDSLWHAHRILEKTLGKVDGYQSDDGILAHQCAITAVKKLYEKKSAEWSEEDKSVLRDIKAAVASYWYIDTENVILDWLESLKQRIGG